MTSFANHKGFKTKQPPQTKKWKKLDMIRVSFCPRCDGLIETLRSNTGELQTCCWRCEAAMVKNEAQP